MSQVGQEMHGVSGEGGGVEGESIVLDLDISAVSFSSCLHDCGVNAAREELWGLEFFEPFVPGGLVKSLSVSVFVSHDPFHEFRSDFITVSVQLKLMVEAFVEAVVVVLR